MAALAALAVVAVDMIHSIQELEVPKLLDKATQGEHQALPHHIMVAAVAAVAAVQVVQVLVLLVALEVLVQHLQLQVLL
jgi:hypothetical protein